MKPPALRWSRDREAEIQRRMLDVLERRFRRRVARAVLTHSKRLIDGYAALGFVPPPDDLAVQEMREVYRDMALASVRTFGARMITQGKSAGLILETKAGFWSNLFDSLSNAWVNLEPIRRRIVQVTETTRAQIVDRVSRGEAAGLSVDAIARDISKEVPGISRFRGALIARTETHGAANYASHSVATETGLDLVKEWVSGLDHRTRSIGRGDAFDHLAMDGQKRPLDEPFEMPWLGGGGEPLRIMYPGEAGHPGGATINCRCTTVHAVAGLD